MKMHSMGFADARLQEYIRRVNSYPRLDRERELELARRFRKGDRRAGDELARAHLRYSLALALRYRGYGLPVLELAAEGNIGLAVALARFDPERGFRFVTYASHWVRAHIVDYVMRSRSIVGGGSGGLRSNYFFSLRRERARLTAALGDREEVERRLAEERGVSRERLAVMLRQIDTQDISLDVADTARSRLVNGELAVTETQEDMLAHHERQARAESVVRTAVSMLDDRDRFIAERRLMASSEEQLSLAEVGRFFGVSRERARQLEARVKTRLRAHVAALSCAGDDDWPRAA